jgi:hypothetical protein
MIRATCKLKSGCKRHVCTLFGAVRRKLYAGYRSTQLGSWDFEFIRPYKRIHYQYHDYTFKISIILIFAKKSLKLTVTFLKFENLWNWPLWILMWSARRPLFLQILDPPL